MDNTINKGDYFIPHTNLFFKILDYLIKNILIIFAFMIPGICTTGTIIYFKGFQIVRENIFSSVFLPSIIFYGSISIILTIMDKIKDKIKNETRKKIFIDISAFSLAIISIAITVFVEYWIFFL